MEQFASREYFYVGGEYIGDGKGGCFMEGQMYVEKLVPIGFGVEKWPVGFIHGNGQSGTNFLNKPNNTGPSLSSHFLSKNHTVYIIDQTARGRSPHLASIADETPKPELHTFSTSLIEQRFTATKKFKLWPQAELHTQWPGTGQKGDPIFDAYYSTILPSLISRTSQQLTTQKAGAALLDRIGPVILIGHSQGGIYPWLWTDIRPHLVKAILSLEPNGPPFREVLFQTTDDIVRNWGIADIPLTYTFPPSHPFSLQDPLTIPLKTELVNLPAENISRHEISTCILQKEPARELKNLKGIPVLLVTAEASYHAVYDRGTKMFLEQAGVEVEWLRLEEVGIRGNGHLFFMERNSEEIAEVLEGWVARKLGG